MISCTRGDRLEARERQKYEGRECVSRWVRRGCKRLLVGSLLLWEEEEESEVLSDSSRSRGLDLSRGGGGGGGGAAAAAVDEEEEERCSG